MRVVCSPLRLVHEVSLHAVPGLQVTAVDDPPCDPMPATGFGPARSRA